MAGSPNSKKCLNVKNAAAVFDKYNDPLDDNQLLKFDVAFEDLIKYAQFGSQRHAECFLTHYCGLEEWRVPILACWLIKNVKALQEAGILHSLHIIVCWILLLFLFVRIVCVCCVVFYFISISLQAECTWL